MSKGRDRALKLRAEARLDCRARACYNRIDSTAYREFRGGGNRLCQRRKGESEMKNPLDSLWGTIISGLVLTVILYFVVKSILG
jgi:hypothetical protein